MIEIKSKSNSTSKSISKPEGLAVGDLMVAFMAFARGGTPSAPSGWEQVGANDLAYGLFRVYKKIATADDVSASSFTWTNTYNGGGIIYRIKNGDIDNIQLELSSVTPTKKNNLVFVVGQGSDNDSDNATFSNYSVTGGVTPTLTEDIDQTISEDAYRASMGVASGEYLSTSPITAFSVSVSGSPDNNSKFILLIGEKPSNFFEFF